VVEAQLARHTVDVAAAGPLRDEVSTDEITPLPTLVHFDEEIGRYAHTGFKAGDRFPIAEDALRSGGFSVLVAAKRYGKGSSREHIPFAERTAGIRLVVAESFGCNPWPERRRTSLRAPTRATLGPSCDTTGE
jgi:3-isopropylmalate/(R)-2-methylmalate dehydratase large subunit